MEIRLLQSCPSHLSQSSLALSLLPVIRRLLCRVSTVNPPHILIKPIDQPTLSSVSTPATALPFHQLKNIKRPPLTTAHSITSKSLSHDWPALIPQRSLLVIVVWYSFVSMETPQLTHSLHVAVVMESLSVLCIVVCNAKPERNDENLKPQTPVCAKKSSVCCTCVRCAKSE